MLFFGAIGKSAANVDNGLAADHHRETGAKLQAFFKIFTEGVADAIKALRNAAGGAGDAMVRPVLHV